jgi:hypothetical protein
MLSLNTLHNKGSSTYILTELFPVCTLWLKIPLFLIFDRIISRIFPARILHVFEEVINIMTRFIKTYSVFISRERRRLHDDANDLFYSRGGDLLDSGGIRFGSGGRLSFSGAGPEESAMNDLAQLPSLSTLFVTPLPEIVSNYLRKAVMEGVLSLFSKKKNYFRIECSEDFYVESPLDVDNLKRKEKNNFKTIEKLGDHVKSSLHKVLYRVRGVLPPVF